MKAHPTGLPHGDPARSCGACGWWHAEGDAGRCRFAAEGEAPGPIVAATEAACTFWEPMPSCDPCGACCREAFDSVPVTDEDLARLGPENADVVRDHDDGWRDLHRVPSPLGCGTRCVALRGDGSDPAPFRCVVYAVLPTNCRDLDPGSDACLMARRRVGITPWHPTQRPDGPLFR